MDIREGWYIPMSDAAKFAPRWALYADDKGVYYSRGGNKHHECKLSTMKRWIKRAKATRADRPQDKSTEQR